MHLSNNHKSIMMSLPRRAYCPRCGAPNKCAMEEGKSISACWCVSEKRFDVHVDYDGCLCKGCLNELSEERIK